MTLTETIARETEQALKSKDAFTTSALRMLRAALKNAEIEARRPLTEEEAAIIVGAEVKKLRDAIEQFRAGGRSDLIEKNEREIAILGKYLPAQLSPSEIQAAAEAKIKELGATGPADMGKVTGALMKELRGKAEGGTVSSIVKELLGA